MAAFSATPSTFLGSRELTSSSFAPRHALLLPQSSAVERGNSNFSRGARLSVVAGKRRSLSERYGRQQPPMAMPQVDGADDTPKFVIFIKTKNVNIWYPLSIVSGGTTAQMMINLMKWDLGKKMYGGTLTRNIATVIYKDERAIQQTALRQYPMLKGASGFEYGYKLVDKENPKASVSGSGVIKVPPQEELKTVVDKAKDFFSSLTGPKQNTPAPPPEAQKKE